MSGKIIPTILEKVQGFPGIGVPIHFLTFCGQPWSCHGTYGCVIYCAGVLQWTYTEAQGLVKSISSCAILDLVGSILSCFLLWWLLDVGLIASSLKKIFICLVLAVLSLHCCAQAFSSRGEWIYYPLAAVCGLLIVVASLVVEYRL